MDSIFKRMGSVIKTYVDTKISDDLTGYSPINHTHTAQDISGLQGTGDGLQGTGGLIGTRSDRYGGS